MLSLLLAFLVTTPIDVSSMCSTDTAECRAYLTGFAHAIRAQDNLSRFQAMRTGSAPTRLVCLPETTLDMERLRNAVASAVKSGRISDHVTGPMPVLEAFQSAYPCR